MLTLNQALEQNIVEADGRYLDTQELSVFEQYVQSYEARLQAYQNISESSDTIVLQALRKLARLHPTLIQKHGQRCRYDMSEVLRYTALAVLRDDPEFFQNKIIFWLDTVLRAHKKQAQCISAYQYLQEAISEALPANQTEMVRPYISLIITSLQTYA